MGTAGVEILDGNVASDTMGGRKWRKLRLIHDYENQGRIDGGAGQDCCVDVDALTSAKGGKQAPTCDSCKGCDDDPNNTKVRADGNSSLPQITTTCLPAHQLDLRKLLVVQSI
jgi:hypothetical protein